jgi:hypothetical protein
MLGNENPATRAGGIAYAPSRAYSLFAGAELEGVAGAVVPYPG